MNPYPLLFQPILKERVWGGRSLSELGKALPPETAIGESWELADLPDSIPLGRSIIANGPLAGTSLRQAIAATPEGGTLYVIPTYTAMLDVRNILGRWAGRGAFWEGDR